MVRIENIKIEKISIHYVGNKQKNEKNVYSNSEIKNLCENDIELLKRYFFSSFSFLELFSFKDSNDEKGGILNIISKCFKTKSNFHILSKKIAQQLYDSINDENFNSGELIIAYFSDLIFFDEVLDAIGIFHSINKQKILKILNTENDFSIEFLEGINIDKLDLGCIIFNTFEASGYKIAIVDKLNSNNSKFWYTDFLNVQPSEDNYYTTKTLLKLTKDCITKQLPEIGYTKSEEIDLLSKSLDYFKNREKFDKNEFEQEVISDPEAINIFRNYYEAFKDENKVTMYDNFNISREAVQRNSKIFKSVLKLDKNFHIYIHGNREFIVKGVEKDGRKYYKLYYENES